jgi:RNA polymerase sigma-70 factor (ECF subfamily)
VRGIATVPDVNITRQRKVVDAFLAAVRGGDFEGLLAVLDPDVVLRSDHIPGGFKEIRGARTIAEQALMFSRLAGSVQPVLVNGAAGIASLRPGGQLFSVMGFTIRGNSIVEIDVMRDPARLNRLDLTALEGSA